jgi:predicted LPLAT superfamily acyltransferase
VTAERWARAAELGTVRSLRIVAGTLRRVPRPAAIALVSAIAVYYALRGREPRRASRDYLARVAAAPGGLAALGGAPGPMTVVRHFREFAVAIYDRLLVWSGALKALHVEHDGSERIFEVARSGRGALLVAAHLGSLDMLWFLSKHYGLRVAVVGYFGNAPRINAYLESLGAGRNLRLIELDPDWVRAAFEIRASLASGELVVMMADRVPPLRAGRVETVPFLGAPARFSAAPFHLALALRCPVFFALCVRTGDAAYRTVLRELSEARRVPASERDKRARELVLAYAAELESWVLRFPLQWFNFYDFWEAAPRA